MGGAAIGLGMKHEREMKLSIVWAYPDAELMALSPVPDLFNIWSEYDFHALFECLDAVEIGDDSETLDITDAEFYESDSSDSSRGTFEGKVPLLIVLERQKELVHLYRPPSFSEYSGDVDMPKLGASEKFPAPKGGPKVDGFNLVLTVKAQDLSKVGRKIQVGLDQLNEDGPPNHLYWEHAFVNLRKRSVLKIPQAKSETYLKAKAARDAQYESEAQVDGIVAADDLEALLKVIATTSFDDLSRVLSIAAANDAKKVLVWYVANHKVTAQDLEYLRQGKSIATLLRAIDSDDWYLLLRDLKDVVLVRIYSARLMLPEALRERLHDESATDSRRELLENWNKNLEKIAS